MSSYKRTMSMFATKEDFYKDKIEFLEGEFDSAKSLILRQHRELVALQEEVDKLELLETWFNRLPDEMVSKSEILEVIRELGE